MQILQELDESWVTDPAASVPSTVEVLIPVPQLLLILHLRNKTCREDTLSNGTYVTQIYSYVSMYVMYISMFKNADHF